MRSLQVFTSSIILILFVGTVAHASTISQESFLKRLKETHPLFEKEKLSAQIAQKTRDGLLGNKDWKINSALFYSHDEPSFAIAGPEKTNAVSISGGLEKEIWSTGGRFSASYSSTYANLTTSPMLGLPNSYFENNLAVTYSHPLLSNKGGSLDRLQYDLSQYDIDLSAEFAIENEELFLLSSLSKFLDWVLLVEQQRIIIERLRLSEEELSRTRDKRASNLIDEVDVIRAEDAVRVSKQNLLLIESQSNAIRSELAVLLQDESINEYIPEYNLYETKEIPTLTEASTELKEKSRLLHTIGIRINQQKRLRTGFVDRSKTNLNFIIQAGLKNAESSYGKSLVTDIPEARIGLQLSFPSGNRTAKANISRADLITLQLEKQYEELTLELSSVVANLLSRTSQLETVLQLNQEQIESAQRKTAEELKLYNKGRGELTFVIQSRDSEQAAKLTYAVNAQTYHKLLLKLDELTDQLHQ